MPGSKTNGLRQRSGAQRHQHHSLRSSHPSNRPSSCHPSLLSLHRSHHLRLNLRTKILTNSRKMTICLTSQTEICQGYPIPLPNIIANVKLRSSLGTLNIDMPLNLISPCPGKGARVPRSSKPSNSKHFTSILLTLQSPKGRNSVNVLACESDPS